jgi:hypothetical protein
MKTARRRKLSLERETLVELRADALDHVNGGITPLTPWTVSQRSYRIICVSNDGGSCIACAR